MSKPIHEPAHCFITYEDREKAFLGIQLLALSMSRYATGNPLLLVFCNKEKTPAWFYQWVDSVDLKIRLELRDQFEGNLSGWNVKPSLILEAFNEGFSKVTWLDGDIIVNKPFEAFFADRADSVFLLSSEQGTPDPRRSEFFGLEFCNPLERSPNTCIVQASRCHIPLFEQWIKFLECEKYQALQALPYSERPDFMVSDQDVLAGLLASELASELLAGNIVFVDFQTEILQFASFGYREVFRRWRGLNDQFVHIQGLKPWWIRPDQLPSRNTRLELSPYMVLAVHYRDQLSPEAGLDWMDYRSTVGRIARLLTLGHPVLRLVPHMILHVKG